jgi:hypothetical protein
MAAIEFHDSHLLAVDREKGALDLNAYVHREGSSPGESEGGYQRVTLSFQNLAVDGVLGDLPFDIYEEVLLINGVRFRDLLPLPIQIEGSVELTLVSKNAQEMTFRGSDLNLRAAGEYLFIETTRF